MGSAWQDIKALHEASTRGAKEGFAFRYFSRPLASFILYYIQHGSLTPNQITILSLLVATVGFGVNMFVLPWWGLILGAALFMAAHVLDALDGQLARHRKAGSTIGMHFDFFIDEIKAYFLYLAIAIRLYLQAGSGTGSWTLNFLLKHIDRSLIFWWALAGFCGLSIGISCTKFIKMPSWIEAFPAGAGGAKPSGLGALIALVEKVGRFVIDYPSYIVFVSIANFVEGYFAVYTVVVVLYAIRALFTISRKLWAVNPYKKTESKA